MADAKMSIAESSSEAHTLMEPVSQPVADLSTMRKAAAVIESRAAELLSRSSDAAPGAAAASAPVVCIDNLAPDFNISARPRQGAPTRPLRRRRAASV